MESKPIVLTKEEREAIEDAADELPNLPALGYSWEKREPAYTNTAEVLRRLLARTSTETNE